MLVDMLSEREPDDLCWVLLNKEFIIYALRNEGARVRLVQHHAQLRGLIVDGLRQFLDLTRRTATADLDEVARFLLALHECDVTQRALEPSRREVASLDASFVPTILAALSCGR